MICTNKKISEIEKFLEEHLSPKRFSHSIKTRANALRLAKKYGFSDEQRIAAACAALSHDIARELKMVDLLNLASRKYTLEKWEIEQPILLHGKAGAVILEENFQIESQSILEAVSWHTTGKPDMGKIAKIVFVADYIAPEAVIELSLDEMVLMVVEGKIRYAKKMGYSTPPPLKALEKKYLLKISTDEDEPV